MLYRHYKNGSTYLIISDTALIEATKERAVVYQNMNNGQIWIRPYADFHALVETADGFVPRFTLIQPEPEANHQSKKKSYQVDAAED